MAETISSRFIKAVKADYLATIAKKKKDAKKALKATLTLKRVTAAAPISRARAPRVKGAKCAELERLRAPVFVALKGHVITSGAAGGVTGFVSRALGAASAALYVDSSSELEGSEETPLGASLVSLAAPAATSPAALTVAVGGASGAAVAAAGVGAGLAAFWAIIADKLRGVALILK
ncbi:hypothetical protein ACEPPN_000820 [Leptodophora sp. 'Broadleaf-Isolate-01']